MNIFKTLFFSVFGMGLLALPITANAQAATTISPTAAKFAKSIASVCPGQWQNQTCLKNISESNMALVSNYADTLDSAGQKAMLEPLKQTCAASTAATQGEYPAEAMKSAFTECANSMYEISTKSSVTPDQSHYQLLIAGILCLNNDPQCELLETSLQKTAKQLP